LVLISSRNPSPLAETGFVAVTVTLTLELAQFPLGEGDFP
jgi:hypothetical protein